MVGFTVLYAVVFFSRRRLHTRFSRDWSSDVCSSDLQSRLGYVTPEEERAILSDQIDRHPVDTLEPVVNRDDLVGLLEATRNVRITDELRGYIVDIDRQSVV